MNGEERPLAGRRVAVTRDASQAAALADLLRRVGAEPVEIPLIEIEGAADPGALDEAIAGLSRYDWIVFTSANAVRYFRARLGLTEFPPALQVCAIGSATQSAVEHEGWKVAMRPDRAVAEGVADAFDRMGEGKAGGLRILFPAAAAARDVVPVELRKLGAHVDVVEAYRTSPSSSGAILAAAVLGAVAGRPDWITLASPSAVKALLAAVPKEQLAGVRIASIGPVTSQAIRKHGVVVDAEAVEQSAEGLVRAIVDAEVRGDR